MTELLPPIMTAIEAAACEEQIVQHLTSARALLYEFVQRDGWRALGYASWPSWAQERFGKSQSFVYRMLSAAQIEHELTGSVEGVLPEAHARVLAPLKARPEQLKAAASIAENLAAAESRAVSTRHFEEAVRIINQPASDRKALHQSVRDGGSVEWYTPATIAAAARQVLGNIDLDPASCALANTVIQAERFYTQDDDGLQQPWAGRLFFNFPYDRGQESWVAKLVSEIAAGRVVEAIGVCNEVPDRGWYQALDQCMHTKVQCDKRVRFWNSAGQQDSPVAANAIFYCGPKPAKFAAVFASFGRVIHLV